MRLGVKEAVVNGDVVPGDVVLDGDRVAAVGASRAGATGTAVPGFIDLQVNGFSGVDFLATDEDGYRRAGEALATTGVTAYQPTFISSPLEVYRDALKIAATLPPAPGGPRILGIHLEGPFISDAWPGAHNPANIRGVDIELAERLCDAGPVTYMTLAPELPRALALIATLARRGIVVACGHSDADATAANAGFDAGARALTHIHNAQRRFTARDPGLAGAALARRDVVVQAIVDHVHIAAETAYIAFTVAKGRFALVTDAVAAAGLGDGKYRLGDREVYVENGAARLADGTLAGGVLTMDQAVRNLVGVGASFPEASYAASTAAARLIGRGDLGELRPGATADVTVVDDSLHVVRTVVGGREVFAA